MTNRAGTCCSCGKQLGYYATKLVEQVPPYRIACFWDGSFKGCAEQEGQPPDGVDSNWLVYSDG